MSAASWRVPSKDYGAQYRDLLPELLPEIRRVLLEDEPVLGAEVGAFEREFATYLGAGRAVGLNSGTDALLLSLRALGVGRGDEVVMAGNAFIAAVSATIMAGARPVLVDPEPETFVPTPAAFDAAIGPRTKAVIATHFYGAARHAAEFAELCRRRGPAYVEDAAQAHGARGADGRRCGSYGAAGCFSFHPSKNLGAFGDGGAVATSDPDLADAVAARRNLGRTGKYEVRYVASNTKLDTLQAAVLRVKLRRLDAWNRRRRAIAAAYRERLAGVGDLALPSDAGGESHVWHLFVVRSDRRDALREALAADGINAGIHYPIPPHLQPLDYDLGRPRGALPATERLARTVLSLPISHEMTDDATEIVCDAIRRFFAG